MFEKLDKTDWKVLRYIVERPYKELYLRKISSDLQISSSSAKKALDKLYSFGLTTEKRFGNLRKIKADMNSALIKYIKITMNLQMLKGIEKKLKPNITVMLFGSMAKGENSQESDIDLFVLTNRKDDYDMMTYKSHKLQIIKKTPAQWKIIKEKDPGFAEEVKHGICLSGETLE